MPRLAWLEVDLDALAENLAVVRELAGPGVAVEPVVKADAYGHGMIPVAQALIRAGADGLCVATLDEALALRAAGIGGRVTVMYPIPASLAADAARSGIAVAGGAGETLARLLAGLDGSEPPLDVELEIETGLGRGGAPPEEAVEAATAILAAHGTRLAGVWTHLQASEEHGPTTAQQARFEDALAALGRAAISVPRRHVAASGALLLDEVRGYDAVRPGLITYGLPPDEIAPESLPPIAARLRPVMALRARPVRVADVPAGQGISYGPTWVAGRPSRIATLPLGYGDGWPRSLSNRAQALVRGMAVPLVGNVAMDAVMADVTDVPGPPVGIDDEFTFIGRNGGSEITARQLAQARTTNSWEVVTAMSGRVSRVYHASAGPVRVRTLISAEDRWLGSSSGTATSAISRSTPS